jgi:DNA-binding transcriptional MerR regulator
MLENIPTQQRATASSLIRQASAELGVPLEQVKRILYWHARRARVKLDSIALLQDNLANLAEIIRSYNQEVTLQQLRKQGPAILQPVYEAVEE